MYDQFDDDRIACSELPEATWKKLKICDQTLYDLTSFQSTDNNVFYINVQ